MKKVLKRIIRWIYRILLGIAALLLLLVLFFYLFRGRITERVVTYINERQPGSLVIEKINLKPFLDFPNVSLRLREVQYLSPHESGIEFDTLPVLDFNDIFVSMDVVQLIRGTYMISEVRLADGTINYRVGQDSVSNLENALGIVFGSEEATDTLALEGSPVRLDLQRLEIRNLNISYADQPTGTSFTVRVNDLESGFSYYPELVTAALTMHSEIQMAQVRDLTIERPRDVAFSSALHYDQQLQRLALDRSTLELEDATFELAGEADLDARTVDLDFSAVNSGIDLLNFLLSGVLDLDAIEQIGEGSIRLEGNASGSYSKQFPVLKVNVSAREMAFYVRAIDQSVTGIEFDGYVTNGTNKDLSTAEVHLNDFHVDFPRGSLDANIELHNLMQPYADITLSGDADLSVINEIISTEAIREMKGNLMFEGNIVGSVNKQTGNFLDSAGLLKIQLSDVGFSLSDHQVQQLQGEVLIKEKLFRFSNMELRIDSNRIKWGGTVRNLLPWFLEFDVDPSADLVFSADELYPGTFLNDSSMAGPVRNLGFRFSLDADGKELRKSLGENSIPPVKLALEDVTITLPGYAPVDEGRLMVSLGPDTATIRGLHARIGESAFKLDAALADYNRLIEKDSTANLFFTFDLSADRLRASDLLTFSDEFSVLPPQFAVEEIHDLKFKGKVETSVYELLKDSILPDFRFVSEEVHWRLREYPGAFSDMVLDVERRDSLLVVHRFAGFIGESNFSVTASVANLMDSSRTITGSMGVRSELLDLDKLLGYNLLAGSEQPSQRNEAFYPEGSAGKGATAAAGNAGKTVKRGNGSAGEPGVPRKVSQSKVKQGANEVPRAPTASENPVAQDEDLARTDSGEPSDLSKIDFPDLVLDVDIKELRYEGNVLKNLDGSLSTKPYKILYFDRFSVQSETGGSMLIDGQFNVSDPGMYMLSANFEIDTVNMSDFNLQIAIGDSLYSLEDNFNGILSADGLAEFFINPDFSINTDFSTAMFNVRLENGRVKHFTPLRALAKYTGNKDLDNVKFGLLRNSFTLMNGAVQIPLMSIESTIGLILLEGEQYLDGDFLYLARLPVSLVRGTAWNMLTNQQNRKTEEGEVQQMRAQKFLVLTVAGRDGTEEVKVGDKRDQFR